MVSAPACGPCLKKRTRPTVTEFRVVAVRELHAVTGLARPEPLVDILADAPACHAFV